MQAPDKSEDSAAGETEPSPSSPSLGSLQLHVAIKKEKPFLRLLPPLVIVTSDETTIALPLSPRKMVEETDFLDDERPLSPGMTQRVRQEIDESYRHARLKAKALSSRGIENESGNPNDFPLLIVRFLFIYFIGIYFCISLAPRPACVN